MTNGMAGITEITSGFPNDHGHVRFEGATISENLRDRGWNTHVSGRWHLTTGDEMSLAASKRRRQGSSSE